MPTAETGRIIPAQVSAHNEPAPAAIKGGLLEHVTGGVLANQAASAAAAKALGAGMKGGRRHKKFRGGGSLQPSILPQAGTMPGISHATVKLHSGDNLAQLKAIGAGMKPSIAGATPVQLGGRKSYRKKSNGRRNSRNRRRSRTKRSNFSRRKRSVFHK